MPEENIESLRRAYAAFSRGDFDEALAFADPDIEFASPGPGEPFRGREAVREWMEPDAFDQQAIEPVELTPSGDKILVEQRLRARGAGSGIELEVRSWAVWTFSDDGFATRMEGFMETEKDRAFEAAGLRE